MKNRLGTILAIAIVSLAAPMSMADLAPYSQDFEALDQQSPSALTDDGWLIFANVFSGGGAYLYGYGVFPAPNGGPGFSGIDIGQGGIAQGDQQLVTYSDYNNGDHAFGNIIEANVFQEQVPGAANVGSTWIFEFDAKRGNIDGSSTAAAFIKVLDPNNGFALTTFLTVDMTFVPITWGTYRIELPIDATMPGQIVQFGFLNTATLYEGSGVFYDNISFTEDVCNDDGSSDESSESSESVSSDNSNPECSDDDSMSSSEAIQRNWPTYELNEGGNVVDFDRPDAIQDENETPTVTPERPERPEVRKPGVKRNR